MLDKIKNNDLVICSNNMKMNILSEMNDKKVFMNVKFMTLREFCDNYFGTYDEKTLYYLMKEFDLKYNIAKEFLDNIYFDVPFLSKYYNYLNDNDLLIKNELFKKTLSNICVINEDTSIYIKKELDKYNVRYVDVCNQGKKPIVYGFDRQTSEVLYVASLIREKIKTTDLNDIYLVNVGADYKDDIKRIFSFYNIPINLESKRKIYGTNTVLCFLELLKKYKDVSKALEGINKNEIYNKIVDILNRFDFDYCVDDVFIDLLEEILKGSTINVGKLKNAVNLCGFDDMVKGKCYFVLGFNQGSVPKVYHDDELISDDFRVKLGLPTSLDKLNREILKVKNFIFNEDVFVSYKLKDNYNTFYPSSLIDDFSLGVIMNPEVKFIYSDLYNKLKLANLLDRYIKYNESSSDLNILFNTYNDIPYLSYDNSFDGVDGSDVYRYLKGKFNLSYSSMNNYFLCSFRFYVQNILKLSPFSDNFSSFIGSLFHYCLSKMYDDDFDLSKTYFEYVKDKDLNFKEQFFVNKLYKNLEFVIQVIKKQDELSSFDKVLTEKSICINKSDWINFKGIVDKIKYIETDDEIIVGVIDYKTGFLETNLDNINYGLHLQLPVYVYLLSNFFKKKVRVVGFYLQKILNNVSLDCDDVLGEMEKSLKLDGYTISDISLIRKFDSSYENSSVIKGMSFNDGFSRYAKVYNEDDLDNISLIVDRNIDAVIGSINDGSFDINPKRLKGKLIGCEFCEFRDLCFMKEKDVLNLKDTKFSKIIGGDNNA